MLKNNINYGRRVLAPIYWTLLITIFSLPRTYAQDNYLYEFGGYHWSVPVPADGGYVDASNGDLHLEIPVAGIPERGHVPYAAVLMYDSHIWQTVIGSSKTWQPTNVANSWGGWRLVTSDESGAVTYQTQSVRCSGGNRQYYYYTIYAGFQWQAPDGHIISFPIQTNSGQTACNIQPVSSADGSDSDQWGYHMQISNFTQAVVYAGDGTEVYPQVEDTNGNHVNTLSTASPLSTVTNCNSDSNKVCYNIVNSQGSTYQFVVTTESIPVDTAFGQSGTTDYSGNITVIESIALPDNGGTYSFSYDSGSTPGHYGELTGMTLATGGSVSYAYSNFKDAFGNVNQFISSRTPTGSGTWTYTPQVVTTTCSTSCTQTVTVAVPNDSGGSYGQVHTFTFQNSNASMALDTDQKYYASSTSGGILREIGTSYSGDLPSVITTGMGAGVCKQTQYTYSSDGYGNVVEEDDTGFAFGVVGDCGPSIYRKIIYTYLQNSDNNMVNKRASVAIEDGSGHVYSTTTINYDNYSTNPLVSVTGTIGHDDTNYGTSYTARGNPTSIDVNGPTTTLAYDTTGQVLKVTDANNNSTSFSYADNYYTDNGSNPPPKSCSPGGNTNAFPTTITAPLNGSISLGYYCETGQKSLVTDQNGVSSYFHYDSWDRSTQNAFDFTPGNNTTPIGGWTLNNYTTATQLDVYKGIVDTSASVSCSSCVHTEDFLDNLGRMTTATLESDPDGTTTSTANYGASGRIQSQSNPYRSSSDPTYGSTAFTYDALNEITQTNEPDGSTAKAYYDGEVAGGGFNFNNQSCSISTYGQGDPNVFVDEAGKQRETWVDALGRTIEVDEPDPAHNNSLTMVTCYGYDVLGNLSSVSQGGQTRTYYYDSLSRLTSEQTPETAGYAVKFYYTTSNGTLCSGDPSLVCRKVNVRGTTATYAYDALNRLTGVSYSGGSSSAPSVFYAYDGTSCPVSGVTNYGKGRMTSISDGSGWTVYCYDAAGRAIVKQQKIASITETTQYAYNPDGTLKSITYPGGHVIAYTVGNAERYRSVTDSTSGAQYVVGASYASPGELSAAIYGKVTGGFNGVTQENYFNNRLEPCRLTATLPGLTPPQNCSDTNKGNDLDLAYSFSTPGGNNGNASSITNNVNTGLGLSFTYDALNRILTAGTNSNSASGCWGQSFGSSGVPDDQWSNLTQMTTTQCSLGQLSVSVNTSTNQVNVSGYGYDADGNMTADGTGTSYTYDAGDRMVQAANTPSGTWTYVYDGSGLRVEKTNGATTTLFWRDIWGETIAETDGSGSTDNGNYREYILFAGEQIAQRDGLSNTNYFYADALGSTVTMTDGSGNPCYEATYTPYGDEQATMTNCAPEYTFAGYRYDSETGLYYAEARYYNPRLGRFMSPDPLSGDVSDPQTLNRYAYVANNSTSSVDPLGLSNNYCDGRDRCTELAWEEWGDFWDSFSFFDPVDYYYGWSINEFPTDVGCSSERCSFLPVLPVFQTIPAYGNNGGGPGPNAGDFITKHDCGGKGRVIGAGRVTNPPSTGAFGKNFPPVTAGTAAIDPTQFFRGMSMIQAKSQLTPYLNGTISGIVTDPKANVPPRVFNGVSDVIGGKGNPRATLESKFHGDLILEINGVPEPNNASLLSDVQLTMSIFVPCPAGTTELAVY